MSGLLPYEAHYINSKGQRINLTTLPYVITESQLFDAKWKLTSAQQPLGEGIRLLGARRIGDERRMTVHVTASSAVELAGYLNFMTSVFDYDIAALSPGKLWVNGQYLSCWCSAREKTLSCNFVSSAVVSISILPEIPAWCTEKTCLLDDLEIVDEDGHSYPYNYDYRYGSGERVITLNNTHYAACPMRITFYGPAAQPAIYINGSRVGAELTLLENESVEIDQMKRTVYKTNASGVKTSCFNSRTKNGKVFEYAPPGESQVLIDSRSAVRIILIEQRSEPVWALS